MLRLDGHTSGVRCLAYSPDGHFLASGDDGGICLVHDLRTREPALIWDEKACIEALTFYGGGRFLVVGTASGLLDSRRLEEASRPLQSYLPHGPAGVRALAEAPDGSLIASAGWDGSVRVWRLREPYGLAPMGVPPWQVAAPITALAVAGGVLAVSAHAGGMVSLLDAHRLDVLTSWQAGQPLHALAWVPVDVLTAGAADGSIFLWETGPFRLVRVLTGHAGPVYGLGATGDGQRLVSAGADGTVRVWGLTTGAPIGCYAGHQRWATCLAVAPDGLTAASGSDDGSVVVWDLAD